MSEHPVVSGAHRAMIGDLDLPSEIRAHLGSDHRAVCVVVVRNPQRTYTLIIEAGWLELAAEVHDVDPQLVSDMTVPRSAIRAVIDHGHRCGTALDEGVGPVWWSDDGIPHMSFA